MAALNDYVGSFANDAAANAYLAGISSPLVTGLMYDDTTLGVTKQYDEEQSAWVVVGSQKAFITPEGGLAIYLINDTGSASVKGELVEPSSNVDNAFVQAAGDAIDPIGAVYEDGVADDALCLVVIYGRCQVLLKDGTASTRGYWVKTSDTAGRADATNAAPPGGTVGALEEHAQEIGHCVESKGSGTDVLAYIMMHFN